MALSTTDWHPDWTVPPGEILADELERRGISQSELARRMERPTKTINEIVNGKAAITADTAYGLELTLGISAAMWLGLENEYRRALAEARAKDALAGYAGWAKKFPIADMRRRGLISPEAREGGELVAELLRFFGVGTPTAWENRWASVPTALRHSPSFTSSPEALVTWIAWGQRTATERTLAPFDRTKLRDLSRRLPALSRDEPFDDVLGDLTDDLAECGVALVLTPELHETHVSGAATWLSATAAVIHLSLRHKTDDHFWFALMHEIAHLLEPRRADHIDADGADPEPYAEDRADRYARTTLLPADAYEQFVDRGNFSGDAVRAFARTQRVAPGIVVGRLQHDGHLAASRLNTLKKPLRFTT